MMNNGNLLIELVRLALEEIPSESRDLDLYIRGVGTIQVVNVQASSHSDVYYINWGALLTSHQDSPYPKEESCHIRLRLSRMIPDAERNGIEQLLNFEDDSIPAKERIMYLNETFKSYLVPWVESCRTVDGIRDKLESGALENAFVHKLVRQSM